MSLPDFLIAGAPKAGTTALHGALADHPQIYLSRVKEPKFFLCDGPPPSEGGPGDAHSYREWIWRRDDYEALFESAPIGALRGESTPLYLADFAAHERMAQLVPEAKIIAILRDPVDRAYSNWAHLWTDGLEPLADFVAACEEESNRQRAGWAPFWRYLSIGRYGEQLAHLYDYFPPSRVHLIRYKELVDRPEDALNAVCRFLGVREGLVTDVPPQNVGSYVRPSLVTHALQTVFRAGASAGRYFPPQVWRKTSVPLLWLLQRSPEHRPTLTRQERARLVGYFADDVRLLQSLTGWDLDDWLRYREAGTYSVRRSWDPSRRVTS